MSKSDDGEVTVYVASLNTAAATELCIRSMRHFANHPFKLVIGDAGSSDRSIRMLRDFEDRGWLELEVAPDGRKHPEWLDQWMVDCATRYAVFCDSDVEFRSDGWLADLVHVARSQGSALVCARVQTPPAEYVHPISGAKRRLAPRPTPWMLMLDVEQTRGKVDESFRYCEVVDSEAFGGKVAYDIGAKYFEVLRDEGMSWSEMDSAFQRKFRHFGGLTWLRIRGPLAPKVRAKQAAKIAIVHAHLRRARALRWGESDA